MYTYMYINMHNYTRKCLHKVLVALFHNTDGLQCDKVGRDDSPVFEVSAGAGTGTGSAPSNDRPGSDFRRVFPASHTVSPSTHRSPQSQTAFAG